ncbi:MAG TPA: sigma-70 family RNA polymerase sigma factor [Gemmatimonadales bacterium]|nr:sigma-70 family RNA polymerase sigma factor [Gemmatimonadales bacterium]
MTAPGHAPEPTDQQLVALARSGDERAYGLLVKRHQDKVFRETYQLVGDWDVADSATHDAFTRAYSALDGFESQRSFLAWLKRIARNAALKRLARRKVATLPIKGSPLADTDQARTYVALQVSSRGASPLDQVVSREQDDRIRRALTQLKPKHREAVLLHVDQVSDAEIARRMGVPVNTARSYLKRGRDKLLKLLEAGPPPG